MGEQATRMDLCLRAVEDAVRPLDRLPDADPRVIELRERARELMNLVLEWRTTPPGEHAREYLLKQAGELRTEATRLVSVWGP
jgi:hypothetical protein